MKAAMGEQWSWKGFRSGVRGGGEPAQADLKERLFSAAAAGGHRGIPSVCFLEVPKLFHALWQGVIPP